MLYLFTGVPGSGKTLNVVSMLAKRKDFKNRPLFIDGIPDLKIPHEEIPEGESIKTWPKWAPDGAIIVVDECQRIFRPRSSSSAVPDYVAELETHRHRGLDFLLITQHPRLIDVHLRSLIEHHTHFGKTNLGLRRKLEWTTGGAKEPESRANIKEALVSVYKLDKSVYGLYKSAEEHTKIKTKRSKVLFLIPIAIAMLGGGLYYFASFWKNMEKPIEIAEQTAQAHVAAQAASPEAQAAAAPAADDGAAGQYAAAKVQTPSEPPKPHLTEEDYQPRIAERPETAPIYDGMNKAVKVMPWPSACVKSDNGCNCYTDQGSKISEISKKTCLSYIKDGLPFNPYKTKQNEALTADTNQTVSEKPQVLTMGGKSPQNLMYDGYEEKALSNEGGKVN